MLAPTAEMEETSGTLAQIASMAAEAQTNVAVARVQVAFMQIESEKATGGSAEQKEDVLEAAALATEHAAEHAAAAGQLLRAAYAASGRVEMAETVEAGQQAVAAVQVIQHATMARTMAAGAQVAVVLSHITDDPKVIAEAQAAALAAQQVARAAEARVQDGEAASHVTELDPAARLMRMAQDESVWTRVAAVQAQVAATWAQTRGLARSGVVASAAATAGAQVQAAMAAIQCAQTHPTAEMVRAAALAARIAALTAAAARVASAQVQIVMARTIGVAAKQEATAAQVAAAGQLQVAIGWLQEAKATTTAVHTAIAQRCEAGVQTLGRASPVATTWQESAVLAQEQAQLAIAWAQAAAGWAQAAIAWAQDMKDAAVAAEAAAIAAESSATRVQAALTVFTTESITSTDPLALTASLTSAVPIAPIIFVAGSELKLSRGGDSNRSGAPGSSTPVRGSEAGLSGLASSPLDGSLLQYDPDREAVFVASPYDPDREAAVFVASPSR